MELSNTYHEIDCEKCSNQIEFFILSGSLEKIHQYKALETRDHHIFCNPKCLLDFIDIDYRAYKKVCREVLEMNVLFNYKYYARYNRVRYITSQWNLEALKQFINDKITKHEKDKNVTR